MRRQLQDQGCGSMAESLPGMHEPLSGPQYKTEIKQTNNDSYQHNGPGLAVEGILHENV